MQAGSRKVRPGRRQARLFVYSFVRLSFAVASNAAAGEERGLLC